MIIAGGGIWLLGSPKGREEPVVTVRRAMRVLILYLIAQYLLRLFGAVPSVRNFPTLSFILGHATIVTFLLIWMLFLIHARRLARMMSNRLLGRRFAYLLAGFLVGAAIILLMLYGPPVVRRPISRLFPDLRALGRSFNTSAIVLFSVALLWYVCLTSAVIRLHSQLKQGRGIARELRR
jgi:hypothetical protein